MAAVIDHMVVGETGQTRTRIVMRGFLFWKREVDVLEKEVVVQEWDTNSSYDTGPARKMWFPVSETQHFAIPKSVI